jgi:hypothetical protein
LSQNLCCIPAGICCIMFPNKVVKHTPLAVEPDYSDQCAGGFLFVRHKEEAAENGAF